jgi:hypothetical protein
MVSLLQHFDDGSTRNDPNDDEKIPRFEKLFERIFAT